MRALPQNHFAGILPSHIPKKLYADVETLQKNLDDWLNYYNNERTHQDKVYKGRTPLETLLSGKPVWYGKNLNKS
ncbi:hypothetical protein NTGHW29_340001 [Candidatus Nitrotoga sp. HW29]|nr:hypothetical protein NTGHW29_340001 [Candidatus Nitrotoga sp. HW29]